jgi:hypothetical protein
VSRKNLTLVDEPAEDPEVGPGESTLRQLAEQVLRKSNSEFSGWSSLGQRFLQWVRWNVMRGIGDFFEGRKLGLAIIICAVTIGAPIGVILLTTAYFGMLNNTIFPLEETVSWYADFIVIWATPLQVGVTVVVLSLAIVVFDWWVDRLTPRPGIEMLRVSATDGGPVEFSINARRSAQTSFMRQAVETHGPKVTTDHSATEADSVAVPLATTPACEHDGEVSLAEAPGSDPVLAYTAVGLKIHEHGADLSEREAVEAATEAMEELTRAVGVSSDDSDGRPVDIAVSHRVTATGEYGQRADDHTAIGGTFQPVIVAAGPRREATQAVRAVADSYGRLVRGLDNVSLTYSVRTSPRWPWLPAAVTERMPSIRQRSLPRLLTESVVLKAKPLPRLFARFFGRTRGIAVSPAELVPYLRLPRLTERTREFCRVVPRESVGNATPHGNLDPFIDADGGDDAATGIDAER